jgi:hypothetical protein
MESDGMGINAADTTSADFSGNTLTITNSTTISANGAYGTGLLVSYGNGHKITLDGGTIEATGANGIGVSFDFGDNNLGNFGWVGAEYRGSYIRTEGADWKDVALLPELKGALVDTFNIESGSKITGTYASIYLSKNAFVKEINVKGATLTGDIISLWDRNDPHVQYSGDRQDLITQFNFNGDNVLNGNFKSYRSANLNHESGTLTMTGTEIDLNKYTQKPGTTLKLNDDPDNAAAANGKRFALRANSATFSAGSVIDLTDFDDGDDFADDDADWDFSYDERLIFFDIDDAFVNSATLQFDPTRRNDAQLGFYDVEYSGYEMSADGRSIHATGIAGQRINSSRAAVSAINAPFAIAAFNPATHIVGTQLTDRFSEMYERFSSDLVNGERAAAGGEPAGLTGAGLRPRTWFKGSYNYQTANDYNLKAAPLMLGLDFTAERAFIGIAANTAFAWYRSPDADVNATLYGGALYGGIRLPHEIKIGFTSLLNGASYAQRRRVQGLEYHQDYVGFNSTSTAYAEWGIELDPVWLRPFVNYDLMIVGTDSYRENGANSVLAIDYARHTEYLHAVGGGFIANYEVSRRLTFDAKIYGKGLFGDRRAQSEIRLVNAPNGSEAWSAITSNGYEISPYVAGFNVGARYKIREFELGASYDLSLSGTDKIGFGHQATINIGIVF